MVRLSEALENSNSLVLRSMHGWLTKFICHAHPKQGVVGNRHKEDGSVVTQEEFDRDEKMAHVCPFVKDSIDSNNFWIESSDLTRYQSAQIAVRLNELIDEFVHTSPEFDPFTVGHAAPAEHATKCFLLYFPNFGLEKSHMGSLTEIDELHETFKPRYMERGLALGQFYPGCAQEGVYSGQEFKSLISPAPAFAIRYLAKHDSLFNRPGSAGRKFYEKYFPSEN